MQVSKWGNSLAVRLPAAVVDELKLKDGGEIEITVRIKDRLEAAVKPGAEELLKRINGSRVRLPADWQCDREETNAR